MNSRSPVWTHRGRWPPTSQGGRPGTHPSLASLRMNNPVPITISDFSLPRLWQKWILGENQPRLWFLVLAAIANQSMALAEEIGKLEQKKNLRSTQKEKNRLLKKKKIRRVAYSLFPSTVLFKGLINHTVALYSFQFVLPLHPRIPGDLLWQ